MRDCLTLVSVNRDMYTERETDIYIHRCIHIDVYLHSDEETGQADTNRWTGLYACAYACMHACIGVWQRTQCSMSVCHTSERGAWLSALPRSLPSCVRRNSHDASVQCLRGQSAPQSIAVCVLLSLFFILRAVFLLTATLLTELGH